MKPTYDQPDDAEGLYRKVLDVAPAFAGKQVLWNCDGVFRIAALTRGTQAPIKECK